MSVNSADALKKMAERMKAGAALAKKMNENAKKFDKAVVDAGKAKK